MGKELRKVNYLNNKDIMAEIHKSKTSYSSFTKPEYHQYDLILNNLSDIDSEAILSAKYNRAKRILTENGGQKKQAEDIDISGMLDTDVVFRIMTYDHIPLAKIQKKTIRSTADKHVKLNFPPFQHWKLNDTHHLECVGKSHWSGDVNTGCFDQTKGQMTDTLARMILKLCDRYSTRGNVRDYCVDDQTTALTKDGWKGINEISEKDTILSYNNGTLTWSSILSIYRNEFDSVINVLTGNGFDAMVTDGHKFVTTRGLVKLEELQDTDSLVLMGNAVEDIIPPVEYEPALLKLLAKILIHGKIENNTCVLTEFDSHGVYDVDLLSKYIKTLATKQDQTLIEFHFDILENSSVSYSFLNSLSIEQKKKFISEIVSQSNGNITISNPHIKNSIQYLCAVSGFRTHANNTHIHIFGKSENTMPITSIASSNTTNKKNELFYTFYKGNVWCPQTEYGSFVAKRNGCVYLTGNTYNDEMKDQAIFQLTQACLKFDESKSDIPFTYFTTIVINSYTRVINTEKRNQGIRDDILEINGMAPSYTRTINNEHETAMKRHIEGYDDKFFQKSNLVYRHSLRGKKQQSSS